VTLGCSSREFLRSAGCKGKTNAKELATCINEMHRAFYIRISKPGTKNHKFRAGWLARADDRKKFIDGNDYCVRDTSCTARGGSCTLSCASPGTRLSGKICNGKYCCPGKKYCCVPPQKVAADQSQRSPERCFSQSGCSFHNGCDYRVKVHYTCSYTSGGRAQNRDVAEWFQSGVRDTPPGCRTCSKAHLTH